MSYYSWHSIKVLKISKENILNNYFCLVDCTNPADLLVLMGSWDSAREADWTSQSSRLTGTCSPVTDNWWQLLLTHFTCCIFQPHSFPYPFPSFSRWQLKFPSSQWWSPLLCHGPLSYLHNSNSFYCACCAGVTWHLVRCASPHGTNLSKNQPRTRAQASTCQFQHLDSLYCLGLFPKNIKEKIGVKALLQIESWIRNKKQVLVFPI